MRWSKPHCNFIAYPKMSSMAALTRFRVLLLLLLQGSSTVPGATRDRAATDNEEDQSFSREEGQREEQAAHKQQMPVAWSVQPHSGTIPGSTRDPPEPRLAQLCNFRLWGDERRSRFALTFKDELPREYPTGTTHDYRRCKLKNCESGCGCVP